MADADWMKYKQIRGNGLPERIDFHGAGYRLEKHFKRDFYAATGLYRREEGKPTPAAPAQIVLKIYHTEPLGIIPLGWLGRRLCAREVHYYQIVDGIAGLSRCLDRFGASGYVREYVPGCNLREHRQTHQPDEAFYRSLKKQLAAIHERGVAHNDLSKPENILVREDGAPTIIDFQIAARFAWRLPLFKQIGRRIVRYLQSLDRYHLDKLHRRARPQDFSTAEMKAARNKGLVSWLHGVLLRRPYRTVRHFVMGRFLRVK
jgi:serine/threonine protein kinase